jgi:hypothetical protein
LSATRVLVKPRCGDLAEEGLGFGFVARHAPWKILNQDCALRG